MSDIMKNKDQPPQSHLSTPFDRVSSWNRFCAKFPQEFGTEEYYKSLENQLKRVSEELLELQEAVKKRDHENILKEYVDLNIVTFGFGFLCQHDVNGALYHVLDNNDAKFTSSIKKANNSVAGLGTLMHEIHVSHMPVIIEKESNLSNQDLIDKNPDNRFATSEDGENLFIEIYSVHRKSDDKICKLSDHPSVDLSEFVHMV